MKKNIIKKTLFVLALSGLILTATACKKDTEVANNTSVQEDMEAEITEQAENASTEKTVSDGTTESKNQRESTEELAEVSDNGSTQTGTGTNKAAANTDRPVAANNQSSQTNNTTIADASQAFDNTNTTVPNNTTGNSNTTPAQHTHTWVAVTETVNHPEEGHYEQVEIAPAFTQPNWVTHTICDGCGFDYTATQTKPGDHVCPDGVFHNYGGRTVQDGVKTTPAVYEDQWVVDKAAWTETVTTGYRCSTCGETK